MHIIEHNTETGEVKEIEMTAAEVKAYEAEAKKIAEVSAKLAAELAAKEAARAQILEKLGLTAEEASLLLS